MRIYDLSYDPEPVFTLFYLAYIDEAENAIILLSDWLELDAPDDWVRHDAEIVRLPIHSQIPARGLRTVDCRVRPCHPPFFLPAHTLKPLLFPSCPTGSSPGTGLCIVPERPDCYLAPTPK